ncbi:MAG: hypothetical protein AAF647_05265, partial [Pseudomonadota bacterium]
MIHLLEIAIQGVSAAICFWLAYRLRALGIWALAPLAWLALAFAASRIGFFARPGAWSEGDTLGFILFGTLLFVPVLSLILAHRISPAFRALVNATPSLTLRRIQTYRIFGGTFFFLAAAGLAPWELALWSGTLDVAIGLTAATALSNTRLWNILGLADFAGAIIFLNASLFGI